jgi:hypothetical protein
MNAPRSAGSSGGPLIVGAGNGLSCGMPFRKVDRYRCLPCVAAAPIALEPEL